MVAVATANMLLMFTLHNLAARTCHHKCLLNAMQALNSLACHTALQCIHAIVLTSTVPQPATGDTHGARQICQHGRMMTSLPWRRQCRALKHCCSRLPFVPHMVSLVQGEWLVPGCSAVAQLQLASMVWHCGSFSTTVSFVRLAKTFELLRPHAEHSLGNSRSSSPSCKLLMNSSNLAQQWIDC